MKQGIGGTKPYRNFHPRQAARGTISALTPTNFGTLSLFHNGPANTIILLRDYQFVVASGIANGLGVAYQQKRLTGTPGTTQSMDPNQGTPAGLVDFSDQAAALTYDTEIIFTAAAQVLLVYYHDFPFAMLMPGWSVCFQNTTKGKTVSGAFIWEVVDQSQINY